MNKGMNITFILQITYFRNLNTNLIARGKNNVNILMQYNVLFCNFFFGTNLEWGSKMPFYILCTTCKPLIID